MTYLNSDQLGRVQRFLPFYLEAQQKIGVPWAMLAALHYRESNLGSSTDRVGGPLQFDPPLSPDQVRRYGAAWKIPDLGDPEDDIRTALLCAAAFVQAKAASISGQLLNPDSLPSLIADVAWSYNGRAYGDWQHSPYVNNDPQHGVQLHIRGTVPNKHDPNKRDRIDQPDTRPGVLAVMREVLARVSLPTPAPGVIAPTAPAAAGGRLLLADKNGQFVVAPVGDFIYYGNFYSRKSNGDLWVRPARPDELK